MAQFILLLYDDPTKWEKMSPQEQQAGYSKYMNWGKQARESGYLAAGNKLVDDAGKVVRGKTPVATDGPYSETKEVLGGFYIIEAANYQDAVKRALAHPHVELGGTIEVRQIEQMPSPS